MADGWANAMRFVDELAGLAERLAAEEARYEVDRVWPRDTGWSAANNRLSESGDFPLDPPTRPSGHGTLFAEAEANLGADIAMLEKHRLPGPLALGNAVPYAADVGWVDGNGLLIYTEASRTSPGVAVGRFTHEWPREVKQP